MTHASKPQPLRPRFDAIPKALRDTPAWMLWRYEWRSDKHGAGKWTKPPRTARGDDYARTNDPATWADFEAARVAAEKADGVGIALTDDLAGVDLDHVLDPDTGEIEPWAEEVIERFRGCYVERSPGGDGLRIFCRGTVHRSGKGGPENRLEVYGKGSPRYLTVTGHRVGDGDVIEAQAALDWLHATYFEKREPEKKGGLVASDCPGGVLSDDDVIRRAREAKNGAKFARLWTGDAGEDASAADAALIGILSFWTQDAGQLDRLFRRSGLMRPKWDEKRGATTYGERTIEAVLKMPGGETFNGAARVTVAPNRTEVERQPLPDELPPVEPFPVEALPDAFRPYVGDVTERMQCPPDFVAVPLLVATAAMAARAVSLRMKRRDDWTEPGNLWGLIVGRPGVMKSPAMDAALRPLRRLEAAAAAAHRDAMREHERDRTVAKLRADAATAEARKLLRANASADVSELLNAAGTEDPPTCRRYVVNSPTWEKLHALLAENPGGLLMERDEMRGWFLDMAREENAEARSFFVKAWSGGEFKVDRIGRGTVMAREMRLSIIGAIQPGPLSSILRGARGLSGDDGLIERFLVAWPDDPGEWRHVDRLPDGAARQRVYEVFDRLDTIDPGTLEAEQATGPDGSPHGGPFLRLGGAAAEAFIGWHSALMRRVRDGDGGSGEAALAKFPHHVAGLALALHLADDGIGAVTEAAMLRALALADYFESHARRLHASGPRTVIRAAKLILAKLREGALREAFTSRDVYRPEWSGLTDREVVEKALDMLAAHGWLAETTMDTGGRPATVYTLTPGASL
mgnify:CR=1 FL=1